MSSATSNTGDTACMRVRDAALGLAILAVLATAPYVGFTMFRGSVPQWCLVFVSLFGPCLFLVLYPLWVARRCGAQPLLKWPGVKSFVREAAIGIGCGIAAVVILGCIGFALYGKIQFPAPLRSLIVSQNSVNLALTCIAAITVVPFGEELFFRGLVYGSLRRWSVAGAIIVQALLFALSHQYGLVYTLFVLVAGVLFGIVYLWRRTLWTSVCMHLTCNTVSVVLLVVAFIAYGNKPILGVTFDTRDDVCRITGVLPGSCAEEAGLESGDIITRLDDHSISSSRDLTTAMEKFSLGSELTITVERSGGSMALIVKLDQGR